jgi:hypothetical protein
MFPTHTNMAKVIAFYSLLRLASHTNLKHCNNRFCRVDQDETGYPQS